MHFFRIFPMTCQKMTALPDLSLHSKRLPSTNFPVTAAAAPFDVYKAAAQKYRFYKQFPPLLFTKFVYKEAAAAATNFTILKSFLKRHHVSF